MFHHICYYLGGLKVYISRVSTHWSEKEKIRTSLYQNHSAGSIRAILPYYKILETSSDSFAEQEKGQERGRIACRRDLWNAIFGLGKD